MSNYLYEYFTFICSRSSASSLLRGNGLKVHNLIDLFRTRALRIKLVAQPLLGQAPRQLKADYPLAHAQHLRIVAQHAALDAEAVVGRDGADALDLVGGDGYAEPRAADEQRAVRLAFCDETRCLCRADRVRSLIVGRVGADVDDLRDARVLFEVLLDGVFVRNAGFLLKVLAGPHVCYSEAAYVAAHGDSPSRCHLEGNGCLRRLCRDGVEGKSAAATWKSRRHRKVFCGFRPGVTGIPPTTPVAQFYSTLVQYGCRCAATGPDRWTVARVNVGRCGGGFPILEIRRVTITLGRQRLHLPRHLMSWEQRGEGKIMRGGTKEEC